MIFRPPPSTGWSRSASSVEPTNGPRTPSCESSRSPSRRSRNCRRGSKRNSRLRTRRDRDQQPAIVVVRGKEVGSDRFLFAGAGPQLEPLAEPPHAPLERELRGIAAVLVAGQPEAFHDLAAHQLVLPVAGQLEDASAGGEDPALLV